jgi:hypothetical protein
VLGRPSKKESKTIRTIRTMVNFGRILVEPLEPW